jgi:molybdenum cofactor cytidylyltransferase
MSDVGIVLLAAGRGTRFGSEPKLLALLDGRPLVRHAAEAALAAQARPVVAVLGAHAEAVENALAGLDLTPVRNADYREGLSTSLRAGLAVLPSVCTAAIVMLGDMPLVSAAQIDALARAFARASGVPSAVVPMHEGRRGNPVLLNLRLLGDGIAGLRGDRGAGPLLAGRTDVLEVAGEPGTSLDIDTPDGLVVLRDHVPIKTRP